MAGLDDAIEIPRKTMVLFFMVDASGSMEGEKIGAVNTAIEEVLPALQELSDENPDALIKVAALEFSLGARWLTPNEPLDADKFRWNYIEAAGPTCLGDACRMLNEKLSRKAFMASASGSYAPVIFLLSDGNPTDEWDSGLELLKQNKWFQVAGKVALAIGSDASDEVLEQFTGSEETVLRVHDRATLKKMIKMVALRSSMFASKSSTVGDGAKVGEGIDLAPVIKAGLDIEGIDVGGAVPGDVIDIPAVGPEDFP